MEEWQRILIEAADNIEKNGWTQGGDGIDGDKQCAFRAILDISSSSDSSQKDEEKALDKLRDCLPPEYHRSIVRWNDDPDTTKEQVTEMLRRVAV